MSGTVLVTGAFGLVGSATVQRLAADGRRVVATDLDTPRNRRAATKLTRLPDVSVCWADLTDVHAVDALVGTVRPTAIVHLAAVIPPFCYAHRELARRVNVDATSALVRVSESQSAPPRFVLASSIAVYGARNPHHSHDDLSDATPVNPSDIYGGHKAEAEGALRRSGLDWLILRLGGVLTAAPRFDLDPDLLFFQTVLPTDGRIQTVEVGDVAAAFSAATTTDVTGEALLIGGDATHRLTLGAVGAATAAAMGLRDALPTGRPGNPDSDADWFATDWMDTARAQEVLSFQSRSWPALLAETRERTGWRRRPLRLASPVLRVLLRRGSPYHGTSARYADPWTAIRGRWGDPTPDRGDS